MPGWAPPSPAPILRLSLGRYGVSKYCPISQEHQGLRKGVGQTSRSTVLSPGNWLSFSPRPSHRASGLMAEKSANALRLSDL